MLPRQPPIQKGGLPCPTSNRATDHRHNPRPDPFPTPCIKMRQDATALSPNTPTNPSNPFNVKHLPPKPTPFLQHPMTHQLQSPIPSTLQRQTNPPTPRQSAPNHAKPLHAR